MTKHEIESHWYPDPIPGFDAIEWKRKIQAEIYEETKHMTPEQRREHTRQASEEFQMEIKRRRVELAVP